MKKIISITAAAAALAVLALAACSSQPAAAPVPATSTTTTSATTTPTTPVSTTPTTPTTAPPTQTDAMDIVTLEGYQAHVTVEWGTYGVVPFSEVLPECAALLTITAPKNYVFRTVTATLRATFPVVGGFSWPKEDHISISESGGLTASCGDSYLNPANPDTSEQWVLAVEKTPNNPTGLPNTKPTDVAVDLSGGKCTVVGSDSGYCTSKYPYDLARLEKTFTATTATPTPVSTQTTDPREPPFEVSQTGDHGGRAAELVSAIYDTVKDAEYASCIYIDGDTSQGEFYCSFEGKNAWQWGPVEWKNGNPLPDHPDAPGNWYMTATVGAELN